MQENKLFPNTKGAWIFERAAQLEHLEPKARAAVLKFAVQSK